MSDKQTQLIAETRGYWGYRELTEEELKRVSGGGCGGGDGGGDAGGDAGASGGESAGQDCGPDGADCSLTSGNDSDGPVATNTGYYAAMSVQGTVEGAEAFAQSLAAEVYANGGYANGYW